MTRYLSTDSAAQYLGFATAQGIRHLVYSGELVPDGRCDVCGDVVRDDVAKIGTVSLSTFETSWRHIRCDRFAEKYARRRR
jgi:hypothetical protein